MVTFVQGPATGFLDTILLAPQDISVVMAGVPVAGNVLLATITNEGGNLNGNVGSITQLNVAWSLLYANPTGGSNVNNEIWIGIVSPGAGTNILVSMTGFDAGIGAIANICEFSGLKTVGYLDQTTHNDWGAIFTLDSGTTPLTTQPNELWIAVLGGLTGAGSPHTQSAPTNGFTLLDGVSQHTFVANCQISNGYLYKIVSATGTANVETTSDVMQSYGGGCIATVEASAVVSNPKGSVAPVAKLLQII